MEICDICFGDIRPEELVRCGAYVVHRRCADACKNHVMFGVPILKSVPMGFVWAENSCFLDALLYAYLVADSGVFKRITEKSVTSFDYSKVPKFDCETNSVFAGKPQQYITEHFREMAGKIQMQLISYVNEMSDPHQDHPQCRRLREDVALCLRSVIGNNAVYSFFSKVDSVTKELVLPIMTKAFPSINYTQCTTYAEEIVRLVAERTGNGVSMDNTTYVENLLSAALYPKPKGITHTVPHSVIAKMTEVFQHKMIQYSEGDMNDVIMLHSFFASLFPVGLSMTYKTRGDNTLQHAAHLNVIFFVYPSHEDAYDIGSLAANQLIVFSNQGMFSTLSKEGIYPLTYNPNDIYAVDRPLRETMELAGERFSLVAVMLHVNGNHFTSYVRFHGKWYAYNDMAKAKRTVPFDKHIHNLFDIHGGGSIVPVLFFYTRQDTVLLK